MLFTRLPRGPGGTSPAVKSGKVESGFLICCMPASEAWWVHRDCSRRLIFLLQFLHVACMRQGTVQQASRQQAAVVQHGCRVWTWSKRVQARVQGLEPLKRAWLQALLEGDQRALRPRLLEPACGAPGRVYRLASTTSYWHMRGTQQHRLSLDGTA